MWWQELYNVADADFWLVKGAFKENKKAFYVIFYKS